MGIEDARFKHWLLQHDNGYLQWLYGLYVISKGMPNKPIRVNTNVNITLEPPKPIHEKEIAALKHQLDASYPNGEEE